MLVEFSRVRLSVCASVRRPFVALVPLIAGRIVPSRPSRDTASRRRPTARPGPASSCLTLGMDDATDGRAGQTQPRESLLLPTDRT